MITIDGSVLEGGGQILRNALAACCLLSKPLTVNNIRAGRSSPGLRPQHLTGLQLLSELSNAKLEGAQKGSTTISFTPSQISGGRYYADPKTAGSVCLLFQVALPCALFANGDVELHLKGGTNCDMAPQIDFTLQDYGVCIYRGFYPKGGGIVQISTKPISHLKPLILTDRGSPGSITITSFVAGTLPLKIAHIAANVASGILSRQFRDVPIEVNAYKEPQANAFGNGSGIVVVLKTSTDCLLCGSALGSRQVSAEQMSEEAANMLLDNWKQGGCVDSFMQDQLILLMALAKGTSRVLSGPLTLHTKTAIFIVEEIFGVKISCVEQENGTVEICCTGIGLEKK